MWSIDKLQVLWYLASKLHQQQTYGGAEEGLHLAYISHIGSVTFEVLNALQFEKGWDQDLALSCALLHDALEDTPLPFDTIATTFGVAVAQGVAALTKDDTLATKQQRMADSLARIQAQPREVWAVKMADRICNLYAPPFYWDTDKKTAYLSEARLIHKELHPASEYLADRLENKIRAYERFLKGG